MKLAGKYIWITGASRGIGLALAFQAIKEGAAYLLLSASNAERLADAKRQCDELCARSNAICQIHVSHFDVGSEAACLAAAEQALNLMPRIDILINNAGISQRSPMLATQPDVEKKLMDVNFWGAVYLSRAVLPQMLEQGTGYIGVTSSVTGLFGVPLRTSYCAGKHALNGYFLSLLSEYYHAGLRVCLLCPGKINTEISKSALTGDGKPLGIIERGHSNGISAERCAKIFWSGLKRGRVMVYAAKSEWFMIILQRLSPQLAASLIRKVLPLKENSEQSKERENARW